MTQADREWLPRPAPGDVLLAKLLGPLGLSQTRLAKAIGVPPRRINEIILGKRAITADTDLRLGRYFGVEPGFFLRLQTDYDLYVHRRKIEPLLDRIVPHPKA